MLRFAGFEIDQQRAEVRGPNGEAVRLRPKPFAMLTVLASNAGRIVSKQEIMEAVWPNVHVGEDSLFQCIREIRTALGDEERRLIKVVSGRGYLFEAEVEAGGAEGPVVAEGAGEAGGDTAAVAPEQARPRRRVGSRTRTWIAAALIGASVGVAGAALLAPGSLLFPKPPAVVVMPVAAPGGDPDVAAMAIGVTDRLLDGFARIENVRAMAHRAETKQASEPIAGPTVRADFILQGDLQRSGDSLRLQARLIRTATGEVQAVAETSVELGDVNPQLQQTRLAAGAGDILARRLNAALEAGSRSGTDTTVPAGSAKVVVEQAIASINQTTRERFETAQSMLETALADAPDNVDLQVTLAALQTRGIQMTWYAPEQHAEAEGQARALLEAALSTAPRYMPVLEAYCRFLTATNQFAESLVACARVLSFDPWNGSALYQLGLTQIQLGRFEDALKSFEQADRYDTPDVSRWTWLLGIGWAKLLLGQDEEAIGWIERSIAITPASGRPYFLLAIANHHLGRTEEARAAIAKAMELRPGSSLLNVGPPTKNASPVFIEAGKRFNRILVELGLPQS